MCGYTTPVKAVRKQLKEKRGGATDARLVCVVTVPPGKRKKNFRLPSKEDIASVRRSADKLRQLETKYGVEPALTPNEKLPPHGTLGFRVQPYGVEKWKDIFTPRQLLALVTFKNLVRQYIDSLPDKDHDIRHSLTVAFTTVINRLADQNASLCTWMLSSNSAHVFALWALPMVSDFAEVNPLAGVGGSPNYAIRRISKAIDELTFPYCGQRTVAQHDAEALPLPDDSAAALITDPPYYDAIPYAALLDFFVVWMKRVFENGGAINLEDGLNPKSNECIVDKNHGKDKSYFEHKMERSLSDARRVVAPWGVGVIVFAHKSTTGWEAQLEALLRAGWVVTASWPIDTEKGSRRRAIGSAALASSVHLVCRPRKNYDGSLREGDIGDWRLVLEELPRRIHLWMSRLAEEGVVGADAIFSCIGPALEIFSKHSRVERSDGSPVSLRNYLEHVWAAVAREALNMVFEGADASGFEEDARLTAMWLWTIMADVPKNGDNNQNRDTTVKSSQGYVLEFDAARKIAQGLGVHLDGMDHVVEIKKGRARLLSVAERSNYLLGKVKGEIPMRKSKKAGQLDLFAGKKGIDDDAHWFAEAFKVGTTTLDCVHQGMILFAADRGDALRRFITDDGVGKRPRFWYLAQALSALYPSNTDEKRWVDGMLARKKSFGF